MTNYSFSIDSLQNHELSLFWCLCIKLIKALCDLLNVYKTLTAKMTLFCTQKYNFGWVFLVVSVILTTVNALLAIIHKVTLTKSCKCHMNMNFTSL